MALRLTPCSEEILCPHVTCFPTVSMLVDLEQETNISQIAISPTRCPTCCNWTAIHIHHLALNRVECIEIFRNRYIIGLSVFHHHVLKIGHIVLPNNAINWASINPQRQTNRSPSDCGGTRAKDSGIVDDAAPVVESLDTRELV